MLIAGAGKHVKDLLCVLEEDSASEEIVLFEDIKTRLETSLFEKYRILRTIKAAEEHFKRDPRFAIGIGGCKSRETIFNKLKNAGGEVVSLISNKASIGTHDVARGDGLNIMPYVFLSNSVRIGDGTLLNTRSMIHHDVTVGKFCDISPAAVLLGGAMIGDYSHIGANATILPNIKIGENCIIGAGAVVTKDVEDHMVVAGNPAKPLR
jgi:sugar O-acyltransferase (sialic acid O-acetyltransferase NeuD family)